MSSAGPSSMRASNSSIPSRTAPAWSMTEGSASTPALASPSRHAARCAGGPRRRCDGRSRTASVGSRRPGGTCTRSGARAERSPALGRPRRPGHA
jgi:hypothetical protein